MSLQSDRPHPATPPPRHHATTPRHHPVALPHHPATLSHHRAALPQPPHALPHLTAKLLRVHRDITALFVATSSRHTPRAAVSFIARDVPRLKVELGVGRYDEILQIKLKINDDIPLLTPGPKPLKNPKQIRRDSQRVRFYRNKRSVKC